MCQVANPYFAKFILKTFWNIVYFLGLPKVKDSLISHHVEVPLWTPYPSCAIVSLFRVLLRIFRIWIYFTYKTKFWAVVKEALQHETKRLDLRFASNHRMTCITRSFKSTRLKRKNSDQVQVTETKVASLRCRELRIINSRDPQAVVAGLYLSCSRKPKPYTEVGADEDRNILLMDSDRSRSGSSRHGGRGQGVPIERAGGMNSLLACNSYSNRAGTWSRASYSGRYSHYGSIEQRRYLEIWPRDGVGPTRPSYPTW